jgi:hypothetical protein
MSCPSGSYCPINSTEHITCPMGSYCPANVSEPITCPAGTYCPTMGLSKPISTPPGTFLPHTGATSVNDARICPIGSYCPTGSTNAIPCSSDAYCTITGVSQNGIIGRPIKPAPPPGTDCQVSSWKVVDQCSAICGGGTLTRFRKVVTNQGIGGKRCPELNETIPCNTHACAAINLIPNTDYSIFTIVLPSNMTGAITYTISKNSIFTLNETTLTRNVSKISQPNADTPSDTSITFTVKDITNNLEASITIHVVSWTQPATGYNRNNIANYTWTVPGYTKMFANVTGSVGTWGGNGGTVWASLGVIPVTSLQIRVGTYFGATGGVGAGYSGTGIGGDYSAILTDIPYLVGAGGGAGGGSDYSTNLRGGNGGAGINGEGDKGEKNNLYYNGASIHTGRVISPYLGGSTIFDAPGGSEISNGAGIFGNDIIPTDKKQGPFQIGGMGGIAGGGGGGGQQSGGGGGSSYANTTYTSNPFYTSINQGVGFVTIIYY